MIGEIIQHHNQLRIRGQLPWLSSRSLHQHGWSSVFLYTPENMEGPKLMGLGKPVTGPYKNVNFLVYMLNFWGVRTSNDVSSPICLQLLHHEKLTFEALPRHDGINRPDRVNKSWKASCEITGLIHWGDFFETMIIPYHTIKPVFLRLVKIRKSL